MTHSEDLEKLRREIHQQVLLELSHDLKTPLATVIGSLEIYHFLGEKITKEKRAKLVKAALTEAYRLNYYVTNSIDKTIQTNRVAYETPKNGLPEERDAAIDANLT